MEIALETARQRVAPRRDNLLAYERVEWSKAELEGWLIQQAYEGMLRAMEQDRDRRFHAVQAKTAIVELAESVLRRISKVIGGGTSFDPRRSDIGTKTCARSAFCARLGAYLSISCLQPNDEERSQSFPRKLGAGWEMEPRR